MLLERILRQRQRASQTTVTAPRTVIGYHGCSQATADVILAADHFIASTNTYDWLGEGVYFWEYAPFRALEWANERYGAEGEEPAVLAATIHLGRCLNLLDREHFAALEAVYNKIALALPTEQLPRNTASGAHYLDRYIIDAYCRFADEEIISPFQTVRGCFPEGKPIYTGSKLLSKTHAQIAVRDVTCISRVRLVQFH